MSNKPSIPAVRTGNAALDQTINAIRQNLDQITGRARGDDRLDPLPTSASLADVIARLNEVVRRMQ